MPQLIFYIFIRGVRTTVGFFSSLQPFSSRLSRYVHDRTNVRTVNISRASRKPKRGGATELQNFRVRAVDVIYRVHSWDLHFYLTRPTRDSTFPLSGLRKKRGKERRGEASGLHWYFHLKGGKKENHLSPPRNIIRGEGNLLNMNQMRSRPSYFECNDRLDKLLERNTRRERGGNMRGTWLPIMEFTGNTYARYVDHVCERVANCRCGEPPLRQVPPSGNILLLHPPLPSQGKRFTWINAPMNESNAFCSRRNFWLLCEFAPRNYVPFDENAVGSLVDSVTLSRHQRLFHAKIIAKQCRVSIEYHGLWLIK